MIAISAFEKDVIRKKFPNAHIVRTMVHDSHRHHYYCVEESGPMRLLKELRSADVVTEGSFVNKKAN